MFKDEIADKNQAHDLLNPDEVLNRKLAEVVKDKSKRRSYHEVPEKQPQREVDQEEINRRHQASLEEMKRIQKESAQHVLQRSKFKDDVRNSDEKSNLEQLIEPDALEDEYLDIEYSFDDDRSRIDGVLLNGIKFKNCFEIKETLDQKDAKLVCKNEDSNESRLRIPTDILEGVKNYMANLYDDKRFLDLTRTDFVTFTLLMCLPRIVRLTITGALSDADENRQLLHELLSDYLFKNKMESITVEDILKDQLEMSKTINRTLDYLKKNQDENLSALTYGMTWLLMDRMDLRQHLHKQTFAQALQEDGLYDNKDVLKKEAEYMIKRDNTKENNLYR